MGEELDLDLPPGWSETAAHILARPGLTMVWGGPDSGKSTFCRYIIAQATSRRQVLAFIDSDLGQAHLGPPGALALKFFPEPAAGTAAGAAPSLYFIGQTSPPGRLLEIVLGLQQLVRQVRRRRVARILVNTSGLIQGPIGHRLKLAKVEALRPQHLVALCRDQELEPLLRPLRAGGTVELLPLPVSPRARRRSPEERRQYREERFAAYFRPARRLAVPLTAVGWLGFPFGQGEPVPGPQLQELAEVLTQPVWYGESAQGTLFLLLSAEPTTAAWERLQEQFPGKVLAWDIWSHYDQRLVGLLDRQFQTLALGLLLTADWRQQELFILTPLPPARRSQIAYIRLGRLRLTPTGQEISSRRI